MLCLPLQLLCGPFFLYFDSEFLHALKKLPIKTNREREKINEISLISAIGTMPQILHLVWKDTEARLPTELGQYVVNVRTGLFFSSPTN